MAQAQAGDELDLGIEPKKSSKLKLIVIIAVALVLLLGGGAAAYFMLGSEESAETKEADTAAASNEETEKPPPIYHPLDPVFVANMEGRPRLLQVGIQVLVRSQELAEFLKHNDPMIRHSILQLLGAQDGTQLQQRATKEKLQTALLKEIQKIVDNNKGPGQVEALFFTSFVMQ